VQRGRGAHDSVRLDNLRERLLAALGALDNLRGRLLAALGALDNLRGRLLAALGALAVVCAGHSGPDPLHDLVGLVLGDLEELVFQVAALG
jgi:transposase